MKNNLKYAPLGCLFLLYGCTDELDYGDTLKPDSLPILMKPAYPTETRASDAGFDDGDRFGLYVLDYIDENPQDIHSRPHASNVRFDFRASDNTCTGVTDLYWTSSTTQADLVAYYPFTTSVPNPHAMEVNVELHQETEGTEEKIGGYEASDFLYAKASKVMPTENAVRLSFGHVLAGIRVSLLPGKGFTSEEWGGLNKSVIVTNVVTSGSVDLQDGSVSASSSERYSVTPMQYNEDYRAVVIPQVMAAGTSLFGITIDNQGYLFTKDQSFEYVSGKMHTFTITVNKSQQGNLEFELSSEGITPWLDSEDFRDGLMRQYIIVDSPEKGKLEEVMNAASIRLDKAYNLKIRGEINQDDFRFIREKIGALKSLNLYDCTVFDGERRDVIPADALGGKGTMTHFIFPKTVKIIGRAAFSFSGLIGDLIIPEGVEKIGEDSSMESSPYHWADYGAFFNCVGLTGELSLPSTLKFIEKGAFAWTSFHGNLVIPEGVTFIGPRAFERVSFTGELVLPEKIETIGASAFGSCKFSGSLVVPQGIKRIERFTFHGCFNGTLTIPEGVEEIGDKAFLECGFRGELALPSTLRSIEENAFAGNLFSAIVFNDNLSFMGNDAFRGCSRLSGTLTLPKNLTDISAYAFAECSLLDEIVIPQNVKKIRGGAFKSCYNLSSITCLAKEPPLLKPEFIEDNLSRPCLVFEGVPRDNFTVQVPSASVKDYQEAVEWKEFKRISPYSNFVCRPATACALSSLHTEELILNADGDWSVTHMPEWVKLSQTSGSGKTSISISFNQLEKGAGTREDYVEFTLKGEDNVTTRCSLLQNDYQYDENQCITLQKASRGRGIDIVFVGDGFNSSAIASGEYLAQVRRQTEYFFGIEPYSTYRDCFNVYAIISLSQETGVNTANNWRNTMFGTYYAPPSSCTSGMLECHDPDAVFSYVTDYSPVEAANLRRSLVVMTLNSDEYGSNSVISYSGAPIAIVGFSPDPYPMDSRGLMQREAAGVAFGKLADERTTKVMYLTKGERATVAENHSRGWMQNISLTGNIKDVWWSEFIFDTRYSDKVDVYEGGFGKARGCFRSEINSCMNFGIPYFSLAARYDIVKRIMEYAELPFSKEYFLQHDSDKWGSTAETRAPGNTGNPTISVSNKTKYYKSKKY